MVVDLIGCPRHNYQLTQQLTSSMSLFFTVSFQFGSLVVVEETSYGNIVTP